jgi:hypothetical protein
VYIRELHVRNLKLLRDFRLSFTTAAGEPRMWTALVGENGLCKTSVLQAIALAASGPDRSNQLADVPSLPDRRHRNETLAIEAQFELGPVPEGRSRLTPGFDGKREQAPRFVRSTLSLDPGWKVFQGRSAYRNAGIEGGPDPLREVRAQGLPWWFVAGYGVDRRLPRPLSTSRPEDPTLNRLDSLFDRGAVIGTGFADLLREIGVEPGDFTKVLAAALLGAHGLLPRVRGLELRGPVGPRTAADLVLAHHVQYRIGAADVDLPTTWLSHGYQSLVSWIADLVGQMFVDSMLPIRPEEMSGLVLVDEIDLHLHPTWQAELVAKLKKVFPKMQFVVTTHSPMVLPGLAKEEIIRLEQSREGDVVVRKADESPALMTGSELYEEFFAIDRLYPNELGEALERYGRLAGDPARSEAEEQEMLTLREKLRAADAEPAWEPVARAKPRKARRANAVRER